jgi:flagellar assembly factor FliW
VSISTTRFGVLEFGPEEVITFPEGLIGFPDNHKFILFQHRGGPFSWLQSVEDPALAFVVIAPAAVVADYEIRIDDPDAVVLGMEPSMEGVDDLALLVIANVTDAEFPTVNLLAPICMRANSHLGVQSVQHHSGLSIRHPIGRGGRSDRVAA